MTKDLVKLRVALMCGTAGFAIMSSPAAYAQAAAEPSRAIDEIVVTGSRIVRDGSASPTPVTVLTAENLLTARPSSIVDALNTLPQFKGSRGPAYTSFNNSNNTNLGNFLNLRGLGPSRSIILLDGVRVPPSTADGSVDIDGLPQALIERVDIVTGGVSAVYGSDAVVGAVNFILDKDFTGVKGSAQAGISRYGDAASHKFSLAAGRSFMDGRLHIEGSVDYYKNHGLPEMEDRPEQGKLAVLIGAGTAAQPRRKEENIRILGYSPSGLITSGPLANQFVFNNDGSIRPFDRGIPTGTANNGIGGDGAYFRGHNLIVPLDTRQAFGRVSFDITPDVTAYVQGSYGRSQIHSRPLVAVQTGINAATVFRDNAYLAPSTVAALGATQSFTVARMDYGLPHVEANYRTPSFNVRTGIEGKLFNSWNWDLTYAYGKSTLKAKTREVNNLKFAAAIDAAVNPANGQIVCRVTLTNPSTYPGCVPYNMFGLQTHTPAQIDFVLDSARYQIDNKIHIFNGNIGGEIFQLPAGAVAVSVGAEYRKQDLSQTSNSPLVPTYPTGVRGLQPGVLTFNFGNVGPTEGSLNVKEVYGEVVVPLLSNLPLISYLEFTGAGRHTDYSTSGGVQTWKLGLNYRPVDDLRIRGTVSRDIAAPNLNQLYAGPNSNVFTLTDLRHTGVITPVLSYTSGNPNLIPENGKMVSIGAVYQPNWLPGFTFSADHYNLLITNALTNTAPNQIVEDCELSNGVSPLCALVIRPFPFSDRTPQNIPTRVNVGPFNQAKQFASGIDFEAAYRFPVSNIVDSWGGEVQLRAIVSHTMHQERKDSGNVDTVEYAGGLNTSNNNTPFPRWSGSLEATYRNGPLMLSVTERHTGTTTLTGVNTRTGNPLVYYSDHGTNPSRIYTDVSVSYKFGEARNIELFLNVQNLFNVQPYIQGTVSANPGLAESTIKSFYDIIGAYYTAGVRFAF
jgi:outer membrane receptor protein involved in Fe transport